MPKPNSDHPRTPQPAPVPGHSPATRGVGEAGGAGEPVRAASSHDFPTLEGYDVIDELGRGGMGMVYEAFQQSTGRRVAVKLMLERLETTEQARRRFEREVELVARLQHPGIVGVIDSGLHKGRYFYVMEFVDGKPLDQACIPGECPPKETLTVIAKVARAIDYAHQRGVMHRDLKPTNVIVDDQREPHVLDFGLAKAFDPHSLINMKDSLSEPGQVIGTLGYMSPEQARGEVESVSVRSDVYALGAIAYDILTGRLPCSTEGPMALVFQRIESRDPERPSSIRPAIDADADAILLKALEKDPTRRYPSAAALAEDIERYLQGRPVTARRLNWPQRAVRWCKRNPAWAGLIGTAAVALVVAGVSLYAAHVSTRGQLEAQRGELEAQQRKQAALDVLTTTLFEFDPYSSANRDLADRAAAALDKVEREMLADPASAAEEAELRRMLIERNINIARYDRAEHNAMRLVELARGMGPGSEALLGRALRLYGQALLHQRDYKSAEAAYRESLEARRRIARGSDDEDVADSMNHLGTCLRRMHRYEEAVPLLVEALEMRKRLLGENHLDVAASVNNLAVAYSENGEYARAEIMYRRALETAQREMGPDHPWVARSLVNIATCLREQGKYEEAWSLLEESRSLRLARFGEKHADVAGSLRAMALLRLEQSQPGLAEPLARQALEILAENPGRDHPDYASAQALLAHAHIALERWDEAEAAASAALESQRSARSPLPEEIADAEAALGAARLGAGQTGDALEYLRRSFAVLADEQGMHHSATRRCGRYLAAALEASGGGAEAEALRAKLEVASARSRPRD